VKSTNSANWILVTCTSSGIGRAATLPWRKTVTASWPPCESKKMSNRSWPHSSIFRP
jgi:hypothetical protein